MPTQPLQSRRSFLKGAGASAAVGVGGVAAAEVVTGGGGGDSTLRVTGRRDGTEYHVRLSDPDAAARRDTEDTEVVSHRQGKTFLKGELDAGDVDVFGFTGGIERLDLTSGEAGFTVPGASGNFRGAARAEGHGFYRFAATGHVAKEANIEREDATMTDAAQGTVDGDADAYAVEGALQHVDLQVVKGEVVALAHSFVER